MNRLEALFGMVLMTAVGSTAASGCSGDAKTGGSGGKGGSAGSSNAGTGGKMGAGGKGQSGGTGGQSTGGSGPDPCPMLMPEPNAQCQQNGLYCPIAGAECFCTNRRWECFEIDPGTG